MLETSNSLPALHVAELQLRQQGEPGEVFQAGELCVAGQLPVSCLCWALQSDMLLAAQPLAVTL